MNIILEILSSIHLAALEMSEPKLFKSGFICTKNRYKMISENGLNSKILNGKKQRTKTGKFDGLTSDVLYNTRILKKSFLG